ncbi:hypothetical protein TCAL_06782 [Tigriopus californicus]|uniref:F-actin-capping protein subunit beta n=1 Tax=Tigriopus californicus TaxID=6832 RepID=A0A553PP61_TIGCA|nr:hypothetical protein TCAL_06782 [Tigriopus californicus]
MLWLQTNKVGSGTMNMGGSLTRQVEQDASVSESSPHIANIGKRNTLNEIYFSKTRDIVNGLRSVQPLAEGKLQEDLQKDLISALAKKNAGKGDQKTFYSCGQTSNTPTQMKEKWLVVFHCFE